MSDKVFLNGEEVETKVIDTEITPLSEFLAHQTFKQGYGIMLLTKVYYVGQAEFRLGNLTIDNSCKVRETDGEIFADVYFPYQEYAPIEQYGKRTILNGNDVIKATARVKKSDIIRALAFKNPF